MTSTRSTPSRRPVPATLPAASTSAPEVRRLRTQPAGWAGASGRVQVGGCKWAGARGGSRWRSVSPRGMPRGVRLQLTFAVCCKNMGHRNIYEIQNSFVM